MDLFLVWFHRLICIVLSLCKHAYKEVWDVKQEIDPYSFFARSCDGWWPDFVTFTACKRSKFGLKRGKGRNAFQTGAKIYLSEKIYIFWVYGHFNIGTKEVFSWRSWFMAETIKKICIKKNIFFPKDKMNILFLPWNMAAGQNLYSIKNLSPFWNKLYKHRQKSTVAEIWNLVFQANYMNVSF